MSERILFDGDTELDHYQVIDMNYSGRQARVLFSGQKAAAFSGLALDGNPEMLFDYNQRFFELATYLKPKTMLLIGGGAYTLPMSLLHALPQVLVDAVEVDAGLDRIAEAFFGLKSDKRLRIVHDEGKRYLDRISKRYELILIDAFVNLQLPQSLASPEAIEVLGNALHPKGVCAVNIIGSHHGESSHFVREQLKLYSEVFKSVAIYPASLGLAGWVSQNFILVGHHQPEKANQFPLRYSPVLTF